MSYDDGGDALWQGEDGIHDRAFNAAVQSAGGLVQNEYTRMFHPLAYISNIFSAVALFKVGC